MHLLEQINGDTSQEQHTDKRPDKGGRGETFLGRSRLFFNRTTRLLGLRWYSFRLGRVPFVWGGAADIPQEKPTQLARVDLQEQYTVGDKCNVPRIASSYA